jgi:hypothetical protein
MATYLELHELRTDVSLRRRVSTALAVKAAAILALETPTAKQLQWALETITLPEEEAYLNFLLAKFKALTVLQLQGAADTAIQDEINAAVDKFTA